MDTAVLLNINRREVVVEIGNEYLKVAEILPAHGGRVNKLHLGRLADVMRPMDEELSCVFRDLGLARKGAILVIPRHLVTARNLRFPASDPAEIDEMLKLEVGRQTPYAREEIVYSYRLTGTDEEGYTGILLVIAKSNVIRERLDLLDSIGVEVGRVILSSEAAYLWYLTHQEKGEAGLHAFIDVDGKSSELILCRGADLVFTRNLPLGVATLDEGEEYFEQKLIQEVGHALQLYQREDRGARVQSIAFAGLVDRLGKAADILDVQLDIPSQILPRMPKHGNVLSKQAKAVCESEAASIISILGVSLAGDALKLDLTPPERHILNAMRNKQRSLVTLGSLAMGILLVLGASFLGYLKIQQDRLDAFQTEIGRHRKDVEDVERKIAIARIARQRLNAEGSPLELLAEISRLTPEVIEMNSVQIAASGDIVLRGRGKAMSDVFRYVTALESSPMLETVKATRTTTAEERGIEMARFEIQAQSATVTRAMAQDSRSAP